MNAPDNLLCALDLPDTWLLSRASRPRVEGWLIADREMRVDKVLVEVAGRTRRARYPVVREDVFARHRDRMTDARCGFVTPPLRLCAGRDHEIDVRVLAVVNGSRHLVLARRIRIEWSDGGDQLFRLGLPGPFKFPAEFDPARVGARDTHARVFVLCSTAAAKAVQAALCETEIACADARPWRALLSAWVAAHDVWGEHPARVALRNVPMEHYAIGALDIYAVLDALADALDPPTAGAPSVEVLSGPEQWLAVPMLRLLFRDARFVVVDDSAAARVVDRMRRLLRRMRPRGHAGASRDGYADALRGRSAARIAAIVTRHSGDGRGQAAALARSQGARNVAAAVRATIYTVPSSAATGSSRPQLPSGAFMRPIFVLGAGRSGTSAVAGAIQAAGVGGYHEGHLFPLIASLRSRVGEALRNASPPVDTATCERALAAISETAIRAAYGPFGIVWLDKTPDHDMLDCMPLLDVLFPRARYVFVRRHPVSVAQSRRRKFGDAPLAAAEEWLRCEKAWSEQRARLATESRFECDADCLRDPATIEGLARFLELDDGQRKRLADYLASERPESTRIPSEALAVLDSLPPARRFDARVIAGDLVAWLGERLDDVDWPDAEKRAVADRLSDWPERLGYRLWRSPGELGAFVAHWAGVIEEYRHTAEYHEGQARYRAERDSTPTGG